MTVVILVGLAVLVIVGYLVWPKPACPSTIHRNADGSLTLKPSGKVFSDMNEFQQWWHSSGENASCPIPVLTGREDGEFVITEQQNGWGTEQTYAKTPIYKADDYEFSRIFGYERDGRMDVPRQNFNILLTERFFDWADRPLTSDERKKKYAGLTEGFTADGELTSVGEARSRYGEGGMPYPTWGPKSTSMTPEHEYELCQKAGKVCTYDAEHDAWPYDSEKRELCREALAVCKRDDVPTGPSGHVRRERQLNGWTSREEEMRERELRKEQNYIKHHEQDRPRSRQMTPGREYELCKKAAKTCTYDAEHDAWPYDSEKRELCREARAVCKRDDMPWTSGSSDKGDDDCKITKKEREVAKLVAKAYEADPDYEPIVTKVGANNWEVTELKPRHRNQPYDDRVDERVVNTDDEQVDIQFRYRDKEAIEQAVDPFYMGIGQNEIPINKRDPFYGPVPGLERPFPPTFDHINWI